MGEFTSRHFKRSNAFIPEYFLKYFYELKLTTTRATIVSSEGPVFLAFPQYAVTTYTELNQQLKSSTPKNMLP